MLFLLQEELCDVNLCTLHCELRNTGQLLCSLGMFAYECESLKNCNAVLAEYGPDSMKGRDRIVVKTKPGQESGIERHNIQVLSFSGIQSYIRLVSSYLATKQTRHQRTRHQGTISPPSEVFSPPTTNKEISRGE